MSRVSLPPEIDSQIRKRFEELEEEAEQLVEMAKEEDAIYWIGATSYTSDFVRLQVNFVSLIQLLSTKRNSFSDLIKRANSLAPHDPKVLLGLISGLRGDYESGMLRSITEMIEANITGDYLEQAEQLLKGNRQGQYSHIPAAVLAGAVLEDGLRRLCARQSPSISVKKPGGSYKMLNALIDDLKNAGLFSELKAKQLRAWADIRNAAAHGQFDDFARADVEQMLASIENFLADYL